MLKRSTLEVITLRAHMNVRRPSLRLPWYLFSQLPNGVIECVRDGVGVDLLVRQQLLVEPLRNIWAVDVSYRPGCFISSCRWMCDSTRRTTSSLPRS
jgi:hypothetical protein